MPIAAEEKLERRIRDGALTGAFFLYGDDQRVRDDAARRLAEAAVDPSTRDFNLDRFHGDDVDPERLAAALSTPPMMAARRVVVLFRAEQLTPTGRRVVEEAVEDLPAGLTFVVTARIPERSRAKFYETLKSRTTSFAWKAPKESEIPGWLMERAESRHGFVLERDAAQALATAVGDDLSLLEAELEKLAGAAEGGRVDRERVRSLVPNVRPVGRWDWLDRVASRDYDSSLRDLPVLLREPSESAVGLLIGMVEQHLYLGVALEGGEGAVKGALGRAGKPYLKWKARIYARQARRWSSGHLDRAITLMRRADRQAKSGLTDRAVLLELLVSLRALSGGGS